jgi:hypothetical protein
MSVVDMKDGGWSSRKFFIVILAMALISSGAVLAIYSPIFANLYSTFIGGILAAGGLYYGSNVTNTYLGAKVNASVQVAKIKTSPMMNEEPEPSEEDLNQNGE